jgi:hypothetical protein
LEVLSKAMLDSRLIDLCQQGTRLIEEVSNLRTDFKIVNFVFNLNNLHKLYLLLLKKYSNIYSCDKFAVYKHMGSN